MFGRLIIATIVVAVAWYAMAYYRKQNPQTKKKLRLQYIVLGMAGLVIILAVTGRLHWISALIAAIAATTVRSLPLIARFFPLFSHLYQQHKSSKPSSGKISTVNSDYLKIILDHDSESMSGEVTNGPHAGEKLEQLSKAKLRELLHFYNDNDRDSFELLRAFVLRLYPEDDWEQFSHQQGGNKQVATEMNRKEALEILGLDESASNGDIKKAHKQLMQRLHPDRGGSPYLAAKINEAKDYLLKRKS